MALKDWKKDKDVAYAWNKFYTKYKYNRLQLWIYENNNSVLSNYRGIIEVQFLDYTSKYHSNIRVLRRFKTKSAALKFAKQYMRTH
jgi:hypothetical protein